MLNFSCWTLANEVTMIKSDKKGKKKVITSPRKLGKHQKQKETEKVVFTEDDSIFMMETEGMATYFSSEEDSDDEPMNAELQLVQQYFVTRMHSSRMRTVRLQWPSLLPRNPPCHTCPTLAEHAPHLPHMHTHAPPATHTPIAMHASPLPRMPPSWT